MRERRNKERLPSMIKLSFQRKLKRKKNSYNNLISAPRKFTSVEK